MSARHQEQPTGFNATRLTSPPETRDSFVDLPLHRYSSQRNLSMNGPMRSHPSLIVPPFPEDQYHPQGHHQGVNSGNFAMMQHHPHNVAQLRRHSEMVHQGPNPMYYTAHPQYQMQQQQPYDENYIQEGFVQGPSQGNGYYQVMHHQYVNQSPSKPPGQHPLQQQQLQQYLQQSYHQSPMPRLNTLSQRPEGPDKGSFIYGNSPSPHINLAQESLGSPYRQGSPSPGPPRAGHLQQQQPLPLEPFQVDQHVQDHGQLPTIASATHQSHSPGRIVPQPVAMSPSINEHQVNQLQQKVTLLQSQIEEMQSKQNAQAAEQQQQSPTKTGQQQVIYIQPGTDQAVVHRNYPEDLKQGQSTASGAAVQSQMMASIDSQFKAEFNGTSGVNKSVEDMFNQETTQEPIQVFKPSGPASTNLTASLVGHMMEQTTEINQQPESVIETQSPVKTNGITYFTK